MTELPIATVAVVPFTLTTAQAAQFLSVSPRTLEDWRLRGGGPPFRKYGRLVRYLRGDLIAFAERCPLRNTGEHARAA